MDVGDCVASGLEIGGAAVLHALIVGLASLGISCRWRTLPLPVALGSALAFGLPGAAVVASLGLAGGSIDGIVYLSQYVFELIDRGLGLLLGWCLPLGVGLAAACASRAIAARRTPGT